MLQRGINIHAQLQHLAEISLDLTQSHTRGGEGGRRSGRGEAEGRLITHTKDDGGFELSCCLICLITEVTESQSSS